MRGLPIFNFSLESHMYHKTKYVGFLTYAVSIESPSPRHLAKNGFWNDFLQSQ